MNTLERVLTRQQQSLLPTEEDICFYEEHGWYISPAIIPQAAIDEAIAGSQAFYRGEKDAVLPVDTGYSDWKPEDGDIVRNNEFVSLQKQELKQLATLPVIGAIAARLARTDEIRILDDQLVYKPPLKPDLKVRESPQALESFAVAEGNVKPWRASPFRRNVGRLQPSLQPPKHGASSDFVNSTVGWHSDRAYWGTCSSDNLLTAWIPFHDCDEARGPLVVIDKSHRWSGLQDMRHFNNPDLNDLTGKLQNEGRKVVKVPMTLKKGQVSFHHCWTIHGSYPNRSTKHRQALAVHLQDKNNRYRAYTNSQGKEIHIFDEQLCRRLPNGDPDFSDPQIFPVVWSSSSD